MYVREGVAVWPTKKQRIMGRLSLIRQQLVMFMAWLPYTQASAEGANHLAATTDKAAVQAKGECLHLVELIKRLLWNQTMQPVLAAMSCVTVLLQCCKCLLVCVSCNVQTMFEMEVWPVACLSCLSLCPQHASVHHCINIVYQLFTMLMQ